MPVRAGGRAWHVLLLLPMKCRGRIGVALHCSTHHYCAVSPAPSGRGPPPHPPAPAASAVPPTAASADIRSNSNTNRRGWPWCSMSGNCLRQSKGGSAPWPVVGPFTASASICATDSGMVVGWGVIWRAEYFDAITSNPCVPPPYYPPAPARLDARPTSPCAPTPPPPPQLPLARPCRAPCQDVAQGRVVRPLKVCPFEGHLCQAACPQTLSSRPSGMVAIAGGQPDPCPLFVTAVQQCNTPSTPSTRLECHLVISNLGVVAAARHRRLGVQIPPPTHRTDGVALGELQIEGERRKTGGGVNGRG